MTLSAVDGVIDLVIFPYWDGKLRQRDIAGARFFHDRIIPRCRWLSTYLERLKKKRGRRRKKKRWPAPRSLFPMGSSIICYRLVSNQMCPPRSPDDDAGGTSRSGGHNVHYRHPCRSLSRLLFSCARAHARMYTHNAKRYLVGVSKLFEFITYVKMLHRWNNPSSPKLHLSGLNTCGSC